MTNPSRGRTTSPPNIVKKYRHTRIRNEGEEVEVEDIKQLAEEYEKFRQENLGALEDEYIVQECC